MQIKAPANTRGINVFGGFCSELTVTPSRRGGAISAKVAMATAIAELQGSPTPRQPR